MEQWYLAQYRPGRANLQKVQYLLENRNIPSWTPQIFTTRMTGAEGKPKKVLEPLFPGYIFIEFDIDTHHPSKLTSLPGMADFVKSCGKFNPVPLSVLDELMNYPIGHRDSSWNNELARAMRLTRRQKLKMKEIMSTSDSVDRTSMFIAFTDALSS